MKRTNMIIIVVIIGLIIMNMQYKKEAGINPLKAHIINELRVEGDLAGAKSVTIYSSSDSNNLAEYRFPENTYTYQTVYNFNRPLSIGMTYSGEDTETWYAYLTYNDGDKVGITLPYAGAGSSGFFSGFLGEDGSIYANADMTGLITQGLGNIPADRSIETFLSKKDSFLWQASTLSSFIPLANQWVYSYNPEGYEDGDFTYINNDLPVVSIWELKNMDWNEIPGKCYVGDCNQKNLRHVICLYDSAHIESETFSCVSDFPLTGSHGSGITSYCTDGSEYSMGNTMPFRYTGNCSKPQTVNFYHVYNDVTPRRDGWEQSIITNLNLANQYFSEFNIHLVPHFYEYEVQDNSDYICNLPNQLWRADYTNNPAFRDDADMHVTVPAQHLNECGVPNAMVFPPATMTKHNFIHEFGHKFGCAHPGEESSLAEYLDIGGVMSYGNELVQGYDDKYIWECKIVVWLLGQNE